MKKLKTIVIGKGLIMNFSVTALALLLIAATVPAFANNVINEAEMVEHSEQVIPAQDVDEQVDAAIESYFDRKNITEGQVKAGGKIYYAATERVAVNQVSRDWAKARQIAFEKALLNIRSRFIFDNFAKVTNETASKLFSDESSDNHEFPKDMSGVGKIEAIWNKLVAGSDAELNRWLADQGVDSSEFDALPPVEKKDLFVDSYISKTLQKAMGDSSGILPMQTFVGSDDKGNTQIGVIALYSPKLKQLASDIAQQKSPMLKGKEGKPIGAYIDLPAEVLASQFGIRVVFDENGSPIVLSYGQWGYSYEGASDNRIARARKTSYEIAETKATEGIINFINNQIALEDSTETGQVVSNYLEKQGSNVTEKDVTSMVEKMMKTVNSKSKAKIEGARRLKKWKYKTEQGHEIVGTVRAWTLAGLEQSREVKNFKSESPSLNTRKAAATQKAYKPGVSSGAELIESDEDF